MDFAVDSYRKMSLESKINIVFLLLTIAYEISTLFYFVINITIGHKVRPAPFQFFELVPSTTLFKTHGFLKKT